MPILNPPLINNHSAPNLPTNPDVNSTEPHNDSSDSDDTKLKQLLAVLKKAIGVKDMGAMRLSLPANLITPMGNLEYWCYLDRPDVFAAIDQSDHPLERMLAVLRWTFTKDSKFIHGPICKPYNSVLGEQFRCLFDVNPAKTDSKTGKLEVFETVAQSTPTSPAEIVSPMGSQQRRPSHTDSLASSTHTHEVRSISTIATTVSGSSCKPDHNKKARVVFLNEQVSHHPPISCFWYESRPISRNESDGSESSSNVIAYGVDQISAKFTGTSVKVFPGPMNKGIYVKLPRRDEEYEITHPTATITGLLRASPYVVISDYTYITCRGAGSQERFRTMISYTEESWIGKARFALEGIIFLTKSEDEISEWTKLKHVPAERIQCRFHGTWRGEIYYTLTAEPSETKLLIDLTQLNPLPKIVKPEQNQTSKESRKFWSELTNLIKSKNYSEATKVKQIIEQNQRDLAGKRKEGIQSNFETELFEIDTNEYLEYSKPLLKSTGKEVLEAEFKAIGYTN
ncbi:hypothetical protein DFH28DRAFT_1103683 [Melampsora americana]|nr:hypothetical protein DFH28DRAFT_1103683 [Melampsora americana]